MGEAVRGHATAGALSAEGSATVSPGGDAAMEANKADTRRASGWRRAGRRGADRLPWRGRACSGWGPRHVVWVQKVLVVDARTGAALSNM